MYKILYNLCIKIYVKPFIGSYSNEDTDYILVDNVSFTKTGEPDGSVVNKINNPSIFVISDSLGQDYLTTSYPRQGWGNTLRDIFGENVNYFNLAISGWSTRTYVEGVSGDSSYTRPIWHKYKKSSVKQHKKYRVRIAYSVFWGFGYIIDAKYLVKYQLR